jgi:hypothetical protein
LRNVPATLRFVHKKVLVLSLHRLIRSTVRDATRGIPVIGLTIGLLGASIVACNDGEAAPPAPTAPDGGVADVQRIGEQLATCFARGMDQIGRSDTSGAKTTFGSCHAATLKSMVTFPDGKQAEQAGPDAFAGFIDGIFRSNGYVQTQHLVGNVSTTPSSDGRTELAFDVAATHVKADGRVDMGNGHWTMQVERIGANYRIVSQSLGILRFAPVVDESRSDLARLVTCFATGMDLIGSKRLPEAKATFAECYDADAKSDLTFPDASKVALTDRDAFADFMAGFFQKNGYRSTQHMTGDIRIQIDPSDATKATINFELTAFHHLTGGGIDLGNGRWSSSAHKTTAGWRFDRQALQILLYERYRPATE